MRLVYHTTTAENAARIVNDGAFRLDRELLCRQPGYTWGLAKVPGVWLSDRPLYWSSRCFREDSILLEVTIYGSDGFLDDYEWKGETAYREFCVPPADLNARIISIHLMTPQEQHEAAIRMQNVPVPRVLTSCTDPDLTRQPW
jgi:hypothetical protein